MADGRYTPNAPSYYSRQAADAMRANVDNAQTLIDIYRRPQIADVALTSLMNSGAPAQPSPNTPSPGQPSQPMASGGDNTGLTMLPGGAPQAPANTNGVGGYSLPQMVQNLRNTYPNASPEVLLAGLQQSQGMLNNTAKMQLQQLMLGIRQENAATNAYKAQVYGSRADMDYNRNFAPNSIPARPPAPMGGPAAYPQQGQGQPNIPQVNQSALQPPAQPMPQQKPPMQMGGPQPYNAGQGQKEEAKKNADLRTQYTASMQNDMQLADNLSQLKTLLSNPNFSTGAGGDLRAQAAGIMFYMTGDPKWNDTATVAQLDQKAMAGILVDQVSSLAASGSGNRSMATDLMKRYVSQMKPEMAKTPDANKSVVEGATATLERNSLMKQFFNDITQTAGIYPHQASQAVLQADRMYPLVTIKPNGSLAVNKDNVAKFSQALSQVSGNDYTTFSLGGDQQNLDRPLTAQELEEYNSLMAAQKGQGGK